MLEVVRDWARVRPVRPAPIRRIGRREAWVGVVVGGEMGMGLAEFDVELRMVGEAVVMVRWARYRVERADTWRAIVCTEFRGSFSLEVSLVTAP